MMPAEPATYTFACMLHRRCRSFLTNNCYTTTERSAKFRGFNIWVDGGVIVFACSVVKQRRAALYLNEHNLYGHNHLFLRIGNDKDRRAVLANHDNLQRLFSDVALMLDEEYRVARAN